MNGESAAREQALGGDSAITAAAEGSKEGKLSWQDAVMASIRADVHGQAEEIFDEAIEGRELRLVSVGDILDHQKFGRCVVQRVDPDQEYATVRLKNNRLVRLNLDVLKLQYTGEEDGHQVFNATPQGS
jgi:hypothetical protein